MTRSRAVGTAAETAVVSLLRSTYWPHAERRALKGACDQGDVSGVIGVCVEVKACVNGPLRVTEWMRQLREETVNAGAATGVLVVKDAGYGSTRVGKWQAWMEVGAHEALVRAAWERRGDPCDAIPNGTLVSPFRQRALRAAMEQAENLRARGFSRMGDSGYSWCTVTPPTNAGEDTRELWRLMYLDLALELLHAAGF